VVRAGANIALACVPLRQTVAWMIAWWPQWWACGPTNRGLPWSTGEAKRSC
jgi:hypothetical protein